MLGQSGRVTLFYQLRHLRWQCWVVDMVVSVGRSVLSCEEESAGRSHGANAKSLGRSTFKSLRSGVGANV